MSDNEIKSITDVKRGMFVKLVDRDSSGKFSYVGEVISLNLGKKTTVGMNKHTVLEGACFHMRTMEGVMGFDMSEPCGNELYVTKTKPKGWAKFMKDPEKFKKAAIEKHDVIKPTKTKRELVAELVSANPRKKESALLKLAKKEIGGNLVQLKNYIKLGLAKK